jgi:L-rhamnose mutarotase
MALVATLAILFAVACSKPQTKRVGMVIGMQPAKIEAYKALHAATNPGVRNLLSKYHMKNFSIYLQPLDDGNYYLFG